MIPFLWISKLRQLRLIITVNRCILFAHYTCCLLLILKLCFSQLVVNILLPLVPYVSFLMPLLPAPYRVIAEESCNWAVEEKTDDDDDDVSSPRRSRYVPSVGFFGKRAVAKDNRIAVEDEEAKSLNVDSDTDAEENEPESDPEEGDEEDELEASSPEDDTEDADEEIDGDREDAQLSEEDSQLEDD